MTQKSTAPARKAGSNPQRNALYAKIQIARKQIGMEEDDYRSMLKQRYGKASLTRLTHDELGDLVQHFVSLGFKPRRRTGSKTGTRPLDQTPTSKKIRALWLSLHALGLVEDRSEKALAAFVKRQAGVDDLRWLTPAESYKVIEALKKWAERDAGVCWDPFPSNNGMIDIPRARVARALWSRLHALGEVRSPAADALNVWAQKALKWPCVTSVLSLPDDAMDRLIVKLGQWHRRARKAQSS